MNCEGMGIASSTFLLFCSFCELVGQRPRICSRANFHEKALFVKADVAAPSCASAATLCPSLCFHPHS